MTYSNFSFQNLTEGPLGVMASQLRFALNPATSGLGHHTRLHATLLYRTPDKSIVSFTTTANPSNYIMLSSWA